MPGRKAVKIRVESAEAFFGRGREISKRADHGGAIAASKVLVFEDFESLLHVLTEKRVQLLREVKDEPDSIARLARRLGRDRSAVTRDVQMLARFGVVQVTEKDLPGHGRQKWVTPVARDIRLTAQL
jgi:predicted transcriptional regulator